MLPGAEKNDGGGAAALLGRSKNYKEDGAKPVTFREIRRKSPYGWETWKRVSIGCDKSYLQSGGERDNRDKTTKDVVKGFITSVR